MQKTEEHLLPTGWIIGKFGDLFEEKLTKKNLKDIHAGTVSFVGMQDVSESAQLSNQSSVLVKDLKPGLTYFERGDVLVAKITPCFENGKGCHTSGLNTEIGFGSTEFHVLRARNEINSKLIYYWSITKKLRTDLEDEMVGSAGHKRVPLKAIQDYLVVYPESSEEQNAIASALSDVDALIEGVEKLIAKKQSIKTATMQQLLTGKTRLPEFARHPDGSAKGYKTTELGEVPEDWKINTLPSVAWFQEGPGVRNYQFTTSGVKLLNGTNIEHGRLNLEKTDRFISEKLAYGQYSHFMLDEEDILIACSGVSIDRFDEKVTVIKTEHLPLCLNTSTMRFKVNSKLAYPEYFRFFLTSDVFKEQIGGKATGSAQLNFGPFHVKQVKVLLPSDAEQSVIATILSDMDAEIEQLQNRLSKTRQIKQGMMQELLTGKTRLPLAQ